MVKEQKELEVIFIYDSPEGGIQTYISPLLTGGVAAIVFCANWLVGDASSIAKKFGISDPVVGLTIVALETSALLIVLKNILSFILYKMNNFALHLYS